MDDTDYNHLRVVKLFTPRTESDSAWFATCVAAGTGNVYKTWAQALDAVYEHAWLRAHRKGYCGNKTFLDGDDDYACRCLFPNKRHDPDCRSRAAWLENGANSDD